MRQGARKGARTPSPRLTPLGFRHVPELPEVDRAAALLRAAAVDRTIREARALHPAIARRLDAGARRSLAGARIVAVERRGKHQLLRLADGRTLHVHFRMAGDWRVAAAAAPPPRHARLLLDLDDGRRVALVDPRALSTVDLRAPGAPPPRLGPEATDPSLDGAALRVALRGRRGPIKPVLLDQRVVAGLGNIYAAEALWHARIDPRTAAASLGRVRLDRLMVGIRHALAAGVQRDTRYSDGGTRLAVYGREGEACTRCDGTIRRIVQAGRSTCFCPRCQRR